MHSWSTSSRICSIEKGCRLSLGTTRASRSSRGNTTPDWISIERHKESGNLHAIDQVPGSRSSRSPCRYWSDGASSPSTRDLAESEPQDAAVRAHVGSRPAGHTRPSRDPQVNRPGERRQTACSSLKPLRDPDCRRTRASRPYPSQSRFGCLGPGRGSSAQAKDDWPSQAPWPGTALTLCMGLAALGAIIGKALTPLASGTGLVLVLVELS